MRSSKREAGGGGAGTRRLRSLSSRVALVALTSAALGGLAASVVAILAVDRLIGDQADQRLRAATITLAGELDEDRDDKKKEPVRDVVDDENGEIVTSGIRLSVFEDGRLVAGDSWAFAPAANACETRRIAGERVRACATEYEASVLVAAQPIDSASLYWLYALAAAGAIGLGAAVGAVSSLGLSRWAVGPLRSLSRTLRSSRPEALFALAPDPPDDYEEVEAVRSALRDLSVRVQELLAQANRFAADAAHELRSPLTALRTELELLAEDSTPPERAALERATERVVRVSELLDRLLVLALPSDDLHRGFETVALGDVVEQVAEELPAERSARLTLALESEGLVRGDVHLLRSLVVNAVENALKFAPDGPIAVRLVERESSEPAMGREVVLEVSDGGPGVPDELRERVFVPFFRVAPGRAPGHGLGLALIGHIARAHGGQARFEPSERGARLVIALPAWRAGAASSEGAG
jgi:two-component system OmpR family sensor kinase